MIKGLLLLALIVGLAFVMKTRTKDDTPGAAAPKAPAAEVRPDPEAVLRAQRRDAVTSLTIKKYAWGKSDFGVMTATFTFENPSDFDVKDIQVACTHSAASGTAIDRNVRVIYEIVPARGSKTIKDFNMGFINSQAVRSGCHIVDAISGEHRPRPAPKTSGAPVPAPKPSPAPK